jgi:hypothetical protein
MLAMATQNPKHSRQESVQDNDSPQESSGHHRRSICVAVDSHDRVESVKTKPWSQYRVSWSPSDTEWTLDCQALLTVSHVAHVPAAVRIVEDGRLRADLVFDTSKLNTERIRVVWLSPNQWAEGFRYGNVRFTFDWAKLVGKRKAFWVESIAYGVEACRILITEDDYSSRLTPYDPKNDDGPWVLRSDGKHYWNGKHCLEIMFEGDLNLSAVKDVNFVTHHQLQCNIDHHTCRYRGMPGDGAGLDFLARLACTDRIADLPCMKKMYRDGEGPAECVWSVLNVITDSLAEISCAGAGKLRAADLLQKRWQEHC